MHVNRYRAVAEALRDSTSRDTAAYLRALWAFVDRPVHVQDRLVGDAYRNLFAYTDSTTNADTLLRVVRGMVKYEGINPHVVYAGGAIRLAERGRDFKEAEQIARDGMKEAKLKIDSQKSIYETVGDYARAVDWMSAFMYDALGVVYFRQNRLDEAAASIRQALELDRPSTALLHLAQLVSGAATREGGTLYIRARSSRRSARISIGPRSSVSTKRGRARSTGTTPISPPSPRPIARIARPRSRKRASPRRQRSLHSISKRSTAKRYRSTAFAEKPR